MAEMEEFSSMRDAIYTGLNSRRKFHDLADKLDTNLVCLGTV